MNADISSTSGQSKILGWMLGLLLIIVLLFQLGSVNAHTPYAQWDAYRDRHLQVLSARSDLEGDAIADQWVALLAEHLPASNAVVSRARDMVRVASLLKTDQAKLAVLSYTDAKDMTEGTGQFEEFGPLPLQLLVDDGVYVLVSRPDLPEDHGFMVVSTLLEEREKFDLTVPTNSMFGIPVHAGASNAKEQSQE